MINKMTAVVLLLCLVVTLGSAFGVNNTCEPPEDEFPLRTDYGECGENVQWMLTKEGVLYIWGSGNMKDFRHEYDTVANNWLWDGPWCKYHAGEITEIVLLGTISSIGDYAFPECREITSVNIPEGIVYIGEEAFRNCSALEKIIIPESVREICKDAFIGCSALQTIVYEGTTGKFEQIEGIESCGIVKENVIFMQD